MEIAFSLNESDVLELARLRLQRSSDARRRIRFRRFVHPVILAVLALAAWHFYDCYLGAILLGVLGAAILLFYPLYVDWLIRRRVHKAYLAEAKRGFLGTQTLRIRDASLEEESTLGEAKIKWDVIGDLTVTPTHAFISPKNDLPSIVIPKDRVSAGNYGEFINAFRAHMDA